MLHAYYNALGQLKVVLIGQRPQDIKEKWIHVGNPWHLRSIF
jgi:hypothetical protein